uniref:Uncharacterized protein n=1 Tax=Populus alba TaxID=43335 RepID=A0A4U5QH11_POPAL|nr:hypothetical protein D5086_0000105520 [Populus alba]
MPLETRSQDARKTDEPSNPELAQAYDQIQQQLNDTRADTNICFRELKEVPHQPPPAPQYSTARDFFVKINGNNGNNEEEEEELSDGDGVIEEEHVTHNPHLSLNALEGVAGLNTLRVTGKVEKQPLFILVDSGSTHNFISKQVADRLHCRLTNIKALTVQVADGGLMTCSSMCNNFQWSIQGVSFEADVYTPEFQNCDMILGARSLHSGRQTDTSENNSSRTTQWSVM